MDDEKKPRTIADYIRDLILMVRYQHMVKYREKLTEKEEETIKELEEKFKEWENEEDG